MIPSCVYEHMYRDLLSFGPDCDAVYSSTSAIDMPGSSNAVKASTSSATVAESNNSNRRGHAAARSQTD